MTGELEISTLLMGLFGGLALFLFGMEMMADALKAVAGERMRAVLGRLTSNRIMGVITGTFVTAVIQSSSVTTVLLVGFISAGLMSLSQSIGVILGADIGTTITAQIVAFKVTKYSLALVAVGFAAVFLGRRERIKLYGSAVMGLGLVFFGMSVMGDSMKPLRSHEPFLDWMTRMDEPWMGILAGTVFTAVIQSSSATTGVVIVLASQGLIHLEAGIAIIFGANIGTCATALLAAIGRPREAVRAATVHVIFKVVGVVIWVAFIHELGEVVAWLSPQHAQLAGAERLAAETPRQIANAHTVFNVVNCFLFLPFTTQFARVVEWMIPDRPMQEAAAVRSKYLSLDLLPTPSLALDRARLEILHMGDGVKEMLAAILPAMLHGTREDIERIVQMDDTTDTLHGHIITYLGQISQSQLTERQTEELLRLMGAANDLESVGDLIEARLSILGLERLDHGIVVSEGTSALIADFHGIVTRALDGALVAVTQKNEEAAQHVIEIKQELLALVERARLHTQQRLVADEPNRLVAYRIECDMLDNLGAIYHFSRRIARVAAPDDEA